MKRAQLSALSYSLSTLVETAGLPVCPDMRELVFKACAVSVWEKVRLKKATRLAVWSNECFNNSCPGLISWSFGQLPVLASIAILTVSKCLQ